METYRPPFAQQMTAVKTVGGRLLASARIRDREGAPTLVVFEYPKNPDWRGGRLEFRVPLTLPPRHRLGPDWPRWDVTTFKGRSWLVVQNWEGQGMGLRVWDGFEAPGAALSAAYPRHDFEDPKFLDDAAFGGRPTVTAWRDGSEFGRFDWAAPGHVGVFERLEPPQAPSTPERLLIDAGTREARIEIRL